MLQFDSPESGVRLCDGVSRRTWLRLGTLGTVGLTLPQWWAAKARADGAVRGATAARNGTAKACIQIYLSGGPGQHETWDLKTEQPAEIRGEFRPIDTSLPGFQICEHMPQMAKRADRYTIIRSVAHTGINHGTSTYHMLTGHIHWAPGTLKHPMSRDMPNIGCNAGRFLKHPSYLPPVVHMPAVVNDGDKLPMPGQDSGMLGQNHAAFRVLGDLTKPDFRIPALQLTQGLSRERLLRRVGLREAIDRQVEHLADEQSGRAIDGTYERAISLLASSKTEEAFDLSREPAAMRERYGMHHFAQSLLLARRLVEHGVPFVTVYWAAPNIGDNQSWDTHFNTFERMREHLFPSFDKSMAAFLDDMADRGLLDETLVTWWGEFGRTPKISRSAGRDHWGFCQSVGLTGGGVKRGIVYGSSTKDGGYADTCAVSPDDLSATIFHCLGIDHTQHMYDLQGRPIRLSFGEPVYDVLA